MAKAFVKLDRAALRKLAPGQKITEHGIGFERLASGDGLWTVNIMVDGVRIHRTIGRESDGTTRTQCEKFIEMARTDARHDRLALPKGRKVALTFTAAADKYLKLLRETGGKNIDAKDYQLDLHLIPFFGDKPLSKIGAFDIERYKKQRLSEKVVSGGNWRSGRRESKMSDRLTSPATVNRELATLGHLLSVALDQGWIKAKPKIKLLKEGSGRITYLSKDQISRLLDAARASDNPQVYPYTLVALGTSMRRMEVLSIRIEHIDLDRRQIYIPHAKAGARVQPITGSVADFLRRYIAESLPCDAEWLYPSATSKSGHTTAIEKPFRAAVVAAGLDPKEVVRHTLRHTAITHLVQSGVDLPTVKRVSGHKTLAMVDRYTHQDSDHLRAAMDRLQERVSATPILQRA